MTLFLEPGSITIGGLILCKNCMKQGKKEIHGRLVGDLLEIQRFHKHSTTIDFKKVWCGICGSLLINKEATL